MVKTFIAFLCQSSFDKSSSWDTSKSNQSELEQQEESGVFCAACQMQLTGQGEMIEIAGAHRHFFINPAGVEFEIALYRNVICQRSGPLVEEHTWFSGYAWQLILCSSCHVHLGWRYRKLDSPDFYGLITDRIIEK